MKRFVCIITIFSLLLITSCSQSDDTKDDTNTSQTPVSTDFESSSEEIFSDRDFVTESSDSSIIELLGATAESSASGVTVNGSTVAISDGGSYTLRGELDGMIVINAKDTDKPHLILDGVNITSQTSAAIYVCEADKLFLTLADGSENSLSNGGEFVAVDDSNIDAVIFSKSDLTLNGGGSLTVTSPSGHGIVSKDDLAITGGDITVTSASHALCANDSVSITGITCSLVSGKDGIHAENDEDSSLGYIYLFDGEYKITSEGDGISASAHLQISGGNYTLKSGGGSANASQSTNSNYGGFPGRPGSSSSSTTDTDSESTKGIKAAGTLLIKGGSFDIDSADDSVHSNTSAVIENGDFEISAGDDAFHADETLEISGGNINIKKSYEGLEAHEITVSGGDIKIVASDDGINAAGGNDESGYGGMRPGGDRFGGSSSSTGSITISGGKIYMNASGDGIDANGSLTISGGYTVVCGPTSGDTSVLDYDNSANITGGTFIGTGAYQMAQTFSDSRQGVIALSVGSQSAGTQIKITNSDGNVIVENSPALSYQIVIISTPDMVKGEEYTVNVGELSGSFEAS